MSGVLIGDYALQQVIGEGVYGRALLCRHEKSREPCVLKEISVAKLANVEKEELMNEASNLKLLNHPNLVKVKDTFFDKKGFYVVTENIDGGSLGSIIHSNSGCILPEEQILDWFIEVCFALKYLHDRKIVHRNLHSRNVLMTKYNVLKLSDLAFAKVLDHSTEYENANYGTPYNMSPEVCLGIDFSMKSDIWSLGVLLYELCTCRPVFAPDSVTVVKLLAGKQPKLPEEYTVDLSNLLVDMLQKNQEMRPTINEILDMPLIRDRVEMLLVTKARRLEFTQPRKARSFGRPNFGQKKPVLKKPKIQSQTKTKQHERVVKKTPPPEADLSGLEVCAVQNDPVSMMTKKVQPKYDVMSSAQSSAVSSRYSSYASGLTLDESLCQSKEEFDKLRAKEIRMRHKQLAEERIRIMKELSEEARNRKKNLDKLEAPFKKIKEKIHSKDQDSEEDMLLLAIEAAKPPPAVGQHKVHAPDRVRELDVLMELIRQRREEVQKTKVAQAKMAEDVIMIGSTEVSVDVPREKRKSALSSQRSVVVPDLEPVDADEDNDNVALAAIAKNLLDIPPTDDESATFGGFAPSSETGYFYCNGLPIDIPSIQDCDSMADRLDCIQQFLEQGLGIDGVEDAKQCISNIGYSDGTATDFKRVFSNRGLLVYFPFVEQYIFCEHYSD